MMLSKEERAASRAICDAATEGPWEAKMCEWECNCCPCPEDCEKHPSECEDGIVINGAYVRQIKTVEYGDYCDMNDADATFCAHARTALPAALDEISRLENEIERLKGAG